MNCWARTHAVAAAGRGNDVDGVATATAIICTELQAGRVDGKREYVQGPVLARMVSNEGDSVSPRATETSCVRWCREMGLCVNHSEISYIAHR